MAPLMGPLYVVFLPVAGFVLAAGLVALLLVWRRPSAVVPEAAVEIKACNGAPERAPTAP